MSTRTVPAHSVSCQMDRAWKWKERSVATSKFRLHCVNASWPFPVSTIKSPSYHLFRPRPKMSTVDLTIDLTIMGLRTQILGKFYPGQKPWSSCWDVQKTGATYTQTTPMWSLLFPARVPDVTTKLLLHKTVERAPESSLGQSAWTHSS